MNKPWNSVKNFFSRHWKKLGAGLLVVAVASAALNFKDAVKNQAAAVSAKVHHLVDKDKGEEDDDDTPNNPPAVTTDDTAEATTIITPAESPADTPPDDGKRSCSEGQFAVTDDKGNVVVCVPT